VIEERCERKRSRCRRKRTRNEREKGAHAELLGSSYLNDTPNRSPAASACFAAGQDRILKGWDGMRRGGDERASDLGDLSRRAASADEAGGLHLDDHPDLDVRSGRPRVEMLTSFVKVDP
jgi:hypothetical protein